MTAAVGVTTGAFYRYFPGKEALFRELFASYSDEVAAQLRRQRLSKAFAGALDVSDRRSGTLRATLELARPGTETLAAVSRARERWVAILADTLSVHVPARYRDLAARLVADLLLHYAYARETQGFEARPAEQVADVLADLVERGAYPRASVRPSSVPEARDLVSRAYEPFIQWSPASYKNMPRSTRGLKTWAAIQEAAVEVLDVKGLGNATMLDFAQRAGISSGTVYRYFIDKEDVFHSLQASAEVAIVRDTHLPLESGCLAVRKMLLAYLQVYRRHIGLFRAWQELLHEGTEMAEAWIGMRQRFIETAVRSLRYGQQQGIAHADIDVRIVAELHSICYEAVAYGRLILGWDASVSEQTVAGAVERMFIGGLAASRPPVGTTGDRVQEHRE